MVMILAGAAVLVVVAFLTVAVVELYRDIELLRGTIGSLDAGVPVPVTGLGGPPSSVGLDPSLDGSLRAHVLLLTDVCATCSSLLVDLAPQPPAGLHVLVSSPSADEADAWVASHGVSPDSPWVRHDAGDEVSRRLGVQTSPLLIDVADGRIQGARTVPSVRALRAALLGTAAPAPSAPASPKPAV